MTVQSECSKTPFGKVSNAAVFLNSHRHKSEVERPLSTKHIRVKCHGHVAIIEGTSEGWTILSEFGTFINPWHNRPFSNVFSAVKAIRYRIRKGKWPTKAARKVYP